MLTACIVVICVFAHTAVGNPEIAAVDKWRKLHIIQKVNIPIVLFVDCLILYLIHFDFDFVVVVVAMLVRVDVLFHHHQVHLRFLHPLLLLSSRRHHQIAIARLPTVHCIGALLLETEEIRTFCILRMRCRLLTAVCDIDDVHLEVVVQLAFDYYHFGFCLSLLHLWLVCFDIEVWVQCGTVWLPALVYADARMASFLRLEYIGDSQVSGTFGVLHVDYAETMIVLYIVAGIACAWCAVPVANAAILFLSLRWYP